MRELDGMLFGADQPCFGCGPNHPAGFRLKFSEDEDGEEVVAHFTPGDRYQGPPGLMHGGLVFTLADELAAWVIIARLGKFGFTARFEGKLSRPTRLNVEIIGRAHMLRSTSRTAEIEATLEQEKAAVFSARFTFVLLDRSAAEKMLGRELPEEWRRFARE
jgi:acyl-coenzyme A thioesterase PaaI-like protein